MADALGPAAARPSKEFDELDTSKKVNSALSKISNPF
jgi:hypothetical protein